MSAMPVRDQAAPSRHALSPRGGRRDVSRARWRLRAVHADMVEFGPAGDPELARMAEELDLLELADAARP
ncbi:hypothetical protein ABZ512_29120 [Nocardiopsis dassonvillei]|uniref:hypothetical protein n=1 Tax=Nocardiopsis dassonvillei TaxID=2014 RepID=UPI0033CAE902